MDFEGNFIAEFIEVQEKLLFISLENQKLILKY